jgi:hypothetical protein
VRRGRGDALAETIPPPRRTFSERRREGDRKGRPYKDVQAETLGNRLSVSEAGKELLIVYNDISSITD